MRPVFDYHDMNGVNGLKIREIHENGEANADGPAVRPYLGGFLGGEFVAGAAGAIGPAGGAGVAFDLLAFGVPLDGSG